MGHQYVRYVRRTISNNIVIYQIFKCETMIWSLTSSQAISIQGQAMATARSGIIRPKKEQSIRWCIEPERRPILRRQRRAYVVGGPFALTDQRETADH